MGVIIEMQNGWGARNQLGWVWMQGSSERMTWRQRVLGLFEKGELSKKHRRRKDGLNRGGASPKRAFTMGDKLILRGIENVTEG